MVRIRLRGLASRYKPASRFDLGYLTVDPKEKKIVDSDRIKAELENGREYYKLPGEKLALPENPLAIPSIEHLNYHAPAHISTMSARRSLHLPTASAAS
jgi:hypothetical protein